MHSATKRVSVHVAYTEELKEDLAALGVTAGAFGTPHHASSECQVEITVHDEDGLPMPSCLVGLSVPSGGSADMHIGGRSLQLTDVEERLVTNSSGKVIFSVRPNGTVPLDIELSVDGLSQSHHLSLGSGID